MGTNTLEELEAGSDGATQRRSDEGGRGRTALVLCLIAVAVLLYLLRYVLLPFVFAAGAAFVASPGVRYLQKRLRMPHWAAAVTVWVFALILLAGGGFWARFILVPQLVDFSHRLPDIIFSLAGQFTGGKPQVILGAGATPETLARDLSDRLQKLIAGPEQIAQIASLGVAVMVGLILALVLLLYFLLSGRKLRDGAICLFPPRSRARIEAIADEMEPILVRYVRGLLIVAAWGFLIVLVYTQFIAHVRYAPILALTVGALEVLLFIGPTTSTILLCIIAIQQENIGMLIAFAAFIAFWRASIDNVIAPIVLGKAVSLHPVVVILMVMAGAALLGVLGVLIAVPAAAAVRVALKHVYAE